jgi:uncharacterized membrane protein YkvA (DUF1232 family)
MPRNRSWTALIPLLTAVLYGASPVDLIPDILLLVGWVDDGVMGTVMSLMSLWLFIRNRRGNRVAGRVPPLPSRV